MGSAEGEKVPATTSLALIQDLHCLSNWVKEGGVGALSNGVDEEKKAKKELDLKRK